MQTNRFVIIGLGTIALELLKRLSRGYEIVCIDKRGETREALKAIGLDGTVRFVEGDATSRLVLGEAAVDQADAVIIAVTNERVGVEVARVLKEDFAVRRVISVAVTEAGHEALDALGVEVEPIFLASAIGIRNRIVHKSKTAQAIGLLKDEILEVEVHPNSRLANKRLGDIDPLRWRVGIIYRDGNIVIPTPAAVLKPRDRVVVLGDPTVLGTVSDILTFNFERFPLEYGSIALIYLTGEEPPAFREELRYVLSVLPLTRALVVARRAAQVEGLGELNMKTVETIETGLPFLAAIEAAVSDCDDQQALFIASPEALRGAFHLPAALGGDRTLRRASAIVRCPILIPRGTFPYERIAVPCLGETAMEYLIEAAVEVGSTLGAAIETLHVRPSEYISDDEVIERYEREKRAVASMALLYKARVHARELAGNPIRAVRESAGEYNLLLLNAKSGDGGAPFRGLFLPDVSRAIALGAGVSTFFIPPVEETL